MNIAKFLFGLGLASFMTLYWLIPYNLFQMFGTSSLGAVVVFTILCILLTILGVYLTIIVVCILAVLAFE